MTEEQAERLIKAVEKLDGTLFMIWLAVLCAGCGIAIKLTHG